MKDKLTEKDIQSILDNSKIEFETKFDKCTVCYCKLPNGFVIVKSTGSVTAKNYDFEIGKKICMERIKNDIWMFEGYSLANDLLANKNG